MWLEAYLRNGKVIQSNVVEVQTEEGQYDHLAGMILNYRTTLYNMVGKLFIVNPSAGPA